MQPLDLTKLLELVAICDRTDGGSRPGVSDGTAVDYLTGQTIPAGGSFVEYYDADGNVYATCRKQETHVVTPFDFAGSDIERLNQARDAAKAQNTALDLCGQCYEIDSTFEITNINAPNTIRADGAKFKATSAMNSVVRIENPHANDQFTMEGKFFIDACCKATHGLIINGLQDTELSVKVTSALSHGIVRHSGAGHGIYYNHFNFWSDSNGGDGVHSYNSDNADPALNFNRIAGNSVNIVARFNRGNGVYQRNTQDTQWIDAEWNSGYGWDLDYSFRVNTLLGVYMENNRRTTYDESCGPDITRTDNGAAQVRSINWNTGNAFRTVIIGSGIIEQSDGTVPVDLIAIPAIP